MASGYSLHHIVKGVIHGVRIAPGNGILNEATGENLPLLLPRKIFNVDLSTSHLAQGEVAQLTNLIKVVHSFVLMAD